MISRNRDVVLVSLFRAFPYSARNKLVLLALELVGVVSGLRTATLIDTLLLSESDARILADTLNELDKTLLVVYESVSGQTLVLSRNLLERRSARPPVFVEVAGATPKIIPNCSPAFIALLSQITSTLSSSSAFLLLSLPDPERPQELVPLVGHLLDYRVAYTLEGEAGRGFTGTNCLGGRELVLVEVSAVDDQGETLRLFSFSYPACLVESEPTLDRSAVVQELEREYGRRTEEVEREQGRVRIEVETRLVELDRVAL
ncbi:hypothetical protein JCM11491_000495 [Sporobolomyces phaffii]